MALVVRSDSPGKTTKDVVEGLKAKRGQYSVYMTTYRGYSVVKGTPEEIVDVLDAAISEINHSEEFVKKLTDIGVEVRPMNAKQSAAYVDRVETDVTAAFKLAKETQK